METLLNKTVGEIAAQIQAAIPVFEDMKIDYCCGGARSLKDACNLAGVSVEKVIELLERTQVHPESPETNWGEKTAAELTDYILQKHHAYTYRQLGRLKELVAKVSRVHGAHHPELAKVEEIVGEMSEEMEGHMAKEEEQVFPYLKAVEAAGWKKEGVPDPFGGGPLDTHPLKVLMWEHGMTGEEFLELHRLTGDFTPPGDACQSYEALYRGLRELETDLHEHVHLENNVLFEKAIRKGILD